MQTNVHIPVRSAISNYIAAIWETSNPIATHEQILPQGIVEIVFNLADPMQGILPNTNSLVKAPEFFLQGWNSNMVHVQYTGRQHLLGIRLHHYMVKPLLGFLPSESKDNLVDLSLVKPGFRILWHRLSEAKDFAQRVAIIEKEFPVLTRHSCARTQFFCDVFTSAGPHTYMSVDELAKEVCYSTRQLNRKAQSLFGVSVEELVAHKRFRTAVELMHEKHSSLTEIAYQAGFYDQAHFCRIFKNFTGITATEYQEQKSLIPFHIFY